MILYISNRSKSNIGAVTHLAALKEIFGSENVFCVDLKPTETARQKENYIAFGKYKSIGDRLLRWMQGNTMFISNKNIEELIKIIEKYNIKFVFSEESFLGNFVKKLKRYSKDIKYICFYHDIGADLYRQRMKMGNFVERLENIVAIRQEKLTVKYSDGNIVFHKADADKFKKFYGIYPDKIIPLASVVPLIDKNSCSVSFTEKKSILFVGSTYYPNVLGINWFLNRVLPQLADDINIKIVGKIGPKLENIKDKRVDIIGPVESLEKYYREADIVIIPLFDGGGMKVKTIEAVSYGKCIVGTEESLHGFWEEMNEDIRGKSVFQCNTPEEWIGVLNGLMKKEIPKFNSKLYELFLQKFSYDAMKKQLAEYLIGREK